MIKLIFKFNNFITIQMISSNDIREDGMGKIYVIIGSKYYRIELGKDTKETMMLGAYIDMYDNTVLDISKYELIEAN